VKLQIAWIGKTKEVAIRALTDEYLKRISRFVGAESHEMNNEPALLELAAGTTGRTAPVLVLLDGRGRQFTSEDRTGERRTFFSPWARSMVSVTRLATPPTWCSPSAK
jgi:23S rRNA pseudoU1915 N3-methylase RlmH